MFPLHLYCIYTSLHLQHVMIQAVEITESFCRDLFGSFDVEFLKVVSLLVIASSQIRVYDKLIHEQQN